jgi:hypothetical protein
MDPTPAILLDLVDGSPVRVWALAPEGFIWNEARNGASWEETAAGPQRPARRGAPSL